MADILLGISQFIVLLQMTNHCVVDYPICPISLLHVTVILGFQTHFCTLLRYPSTTS